MPTDAQVLEALAEVCDPHEPNCPRCADTLDFERRAGWTNAEILEDIALYRSDFEAWAERVRERQRARKAASGG